MNKNFNTAVTERSKDEWLTPQSLIHALGPFDLDPCAPADDRRPWPTAAKHISLPEDGLAAAWHGRVWCNPPYGPHTFKWLEKLADHGNGLALIFARTETKGFHDVVWNRADAVFFFKGRLSFFHAGGGMDKAGAANAPSCLVAYGKNNVHELERAWWHRHIQGKLITLDTPK
jgi:hypothetical protein